MSEKPSNQDTSGVQSLGVFGGGGSQLQPLTVSQDGVKSLGVFGTVNPSAPTRISLTPISLDAQPKPSNLSNSYQLLYLYRLITILIVYFSEGAPKAAPEEAKKGKEPKEPKEPKKKRKRGNSRLSLFFFLVNFAYLIVFVEEDDEGEKKEPKKRKKKEEEEKPKEVKIEDNPRAEDEEDLMDEASLLSFLFYLFLFLLIYLFTCLLINTLF
jgi:hypothetical protein